MQYNCKECGMRLESVSDVPGSKEKCPSCGCVNIYGESLLPVQVASEPAEAVVLDYAKVEQKTVEYAGFWIRVGAVFVDGILFRLLEAFIGGITTAVSGGATSASGGHTILLGNIPNLIIPLYVIFMLCSGWQATLGKRIVKVIVTDKEYNRISFLRSLGRYCVQALMFIPAAIAFIMFFASIVLGLVPTKLYLIIGGFLCCLTLIGYVMAAFDPQKRALHDRIAGTYVIRGRVEDMACKKLPDTPDMVDYSSAE